MIERGEFMMCGLALEVCMRLGHSEKGRKGVFGLGSLWRIVWCMVIGVIGAVKVLLCEKLDLKFTPPVITIYNSISIYIHKHTS